MEEQDIIRSVENCATKTGLAEATICERAVGNSRLYARLKDGGSCSYKTGRRLLTYIEREISQNTKEAT
jgi:hypothetical protein